VRDVRRTHHELVKLKDHLIYANPECFVPALPPPLTSAGAGTEEDEKLMRRELQRWFDIISINPILIRDEEIMIFVESDFGVNPFVHKADTDISLSTPLSTTMVLQPLGSDEKPRNSSHPLQTIASSCRKLVL
jgi:hypothetical protein